MKTLGYHYKVCAEVTFTEEEVDFLLQLRSAVMGFSRRIDFLVGIKNYLIACKPDPVIWTLSRHDAESLCALLEHSFKMPSLHKEMHLLIEELSQKVIEINEGAA